MLKYNELTQEEKNFICNGCGGKGGWIKVPDFLFLASCNQHDFYYWRGGSEEDRKIADLSFYEIMRKDCNSQAWYKIPTAHVIAFTYFSAVRIGGKSYFYNGIMKTKEDLIKEMSDGDN